MPRSNGLGSGPATRSGSRAGPRLGRCWPGTCGLRIALKASLGRFAPGHRTYVARPCVWIRGPSADSAAGATVSGPSRLLGGLVAGFIREIPCSARMSTQAGRAPGPRASQFTRMPSARADSYCLGILSAIIRRSGPSGSPASEEPGPGGCVRVPAPIERAPAGCVVVWLLTLIARLGHWGAP